MQGGVSQLAWLAVVLVEVADESFVNKGEVLAFGLTVDLVAGFVVKVVFLVVVVVNIVRLVEVLYVVCVACVW
jgi:hypothetical protein